MEEKKLRKVYLMVEFGKPFAVKRRCMFVGLEVREQNHRDSSIPGSI